MRTRTIVPPAHRLASLGWALAASLGLAQAAAPGAGSVTRVFVVVVPPAQDQVFSAGIKAWEKCLHDHGSRQPILAYSAETGDLDRYLFLQEHGSWADLDHHDPANKACAPTFLSEILPNVAQAFSEIAVLNARDTYMPGGDPDPAPLMWVVSYRIKPGQRQVLDDAVGKLAAAAAKVHSPAHFAGYDIQGSGQGAEDFVLVWPNGSWADVGQASNPADGKLTERVYGKRAARASQRNLLAAIADSWSDAWRYAQALSYIPGK